MGPKYSSAALLLVLWACGGAEQPPTTLEFDTGADQVMFGMTLVITNAGVMRARVEADTAYQYENRQISELRGVTVHFYNSLGERTSTLTSREGTYEWRTDDMEARGDVVAVTPDGRRLTTELLVYDKRRHEIRGSEPFVYEAPDQRLEGSAFTSDPDFRNVVADQPTGDLGSFDLEP